MTSEDQRIQPDYAGDPNDFLVITTSDSADYTTLLSDLQQERRLRVEAQTERDAYRKTLQAITTVAGNLPDDALMGRTGPNDAAARGLMVVSAREMARDVLAKYATTAPKG